MTTTLESGREMDVEIATRIMGYRWEGNPRGNRWIVNPDGDRVATKMRGEPLHIFGMRGDHIAFYSSRIEHAWLVVDALHARGYRLDMNSRDDDNGFWRAMFVDEYGRGSRAFGESAPLAICRAVLALAALAAVGER